MRYFVVCGYNAVINMLFLVCLLMLFPQNDGAGPVEDVDRNKFLGRYYHVCKLS